MPDVLPDWIRKAPSGKGPRGNPVPIKLLRVNLLQLQMIDQMRQTFQARYFIQLRIENGALDRDLVRDLETHDILGNKIDPAFPSDTLRPGATWFLKQIDFPTSLHHEILMEKVVTMKNHLDLCIKLSGVFFEQFELDDFPFDKQRLTIVVAFNVAKEGIVPIEVESPGASSALSINVDTFALSNLWLLFPILGCKRTVVEPMPNTTYPAYRISCAVERRPGFIITNVFLPMATLTFLSLMQFMLPGEHDMAAMRVTFSVTILLTAATYKLFVSTTLPAVGYMTLCDQYVMACFMLQAFAVAEGAIIGGLNFNKGLETRAAWLPKFTTSLGDFACFVLASVFFVAFHVYFAIKGFTNRKRKVKEEVKSLTTRGDARPGMDEEEAKPPSFLKASTSGDAVARRLSKEVASVSSFQAYRESTNTDDKLGGGATGGKPASSAEGAKPKLSLSA